MQTTSDTFVIGLDIGTSSAKAVAFLPSGEVMHETADSYELEHPDPEAAVQDADTVRDAALESLRSLLRELGRPPGAIGLSSAMHSLLAVDQDHHPIGKLITWADGRAQAQAIELRGAERGRYIYQHSGTPIHAMSPLCKLRWMQQDQPDIFRRAARFVGIKDYLLHHCFGKWLVDHSLASATGLFDLKKRRWIPEALEYAGISEEQLPQAVPIGHTLSGLRPEVNQKLNLPTATPWVIGASDGCLANLGAGVMGPKEAVLTIGTSGAIRRTVTEAVYDEQERIFCYILDDDRYVIGGATNNGGVVWEWFCEQFYPDRTMEQVFEAIKDVPPGAAGLLFLPYLHGERAPVWDASAKGYFWGIEAHHGRDHFARAVLEGICLNLRQIMEALEAVGGKIELIHANGGFTRSPLWVQLLADVLGTEIATSANPHASAWGAAIVALEATRHPVPKHRKKTDELYRPEPARHKTYQEIYHNFKAIYPSAKVS